MSDQTSQQFTHGIPIMINDRPMVFWVNDHRKDIKRILEVDTDYFRYQARVHVEALGDLRAAHGGTAIRLAYAHAAETLFALLFAAIQAPHYPVGWLLRYQYDELKKLIAAVEEGKQIENLFGLENLSWKHLAETLIPWEEPGFDCAELRRANVRLWRYIAIDLMDAQFDDEYMSLKHGFRASREPWSLAISPEGQRDRQAPNSSRLVLANNAFGSTFHKPVNLKKFNWKLEEHRVNWSPRPLAQRIELIANSIDHIVLRLKVFNAEEDIDTGFYFMSEDDVRATIEHPEAMASATRFTMSPGLEPEHVTNYFKSDADVRAAYEELKRQIQAQMASRS